MTRSGRNHFIFILNVGVDPVSFGFSDTGNFCGICQY